MQEHNKLVYFLSTNSHKNHVDVKYFQHFLLVYFISQVCSRFYNCCYFTLKLEAVLRAAFLATLDLCSTFKDMHV